jgi:hypothetical protein
MLILDTLRKVSVNENTTNNVNVRFGKVPRSAAISRNVGAGTL